MIDITKKQDVLRASWNICFYYWCTTKVSVSMLSCIYFSHKSEWLPLISHDFIIYYSHYFYGYYTDIKKEAYYSVSIQQGDEEGGGMIWAKYLSKRVGMIMNKEGKKGNFNNSLNKENPIIKVQNSKARAGIYLRNRAWRFQLRKKTCVWRAKEMWENRDKRQQGLNSRRHLKRNTRSWKKCRKEALRG